MVIDGAGNVGIGTSAPTTCLHVDGSACVKTLSSIYGDNNYFAGCVGIGTNKPTVKLQVHDGGIYAGNGATKGYGFHDFGTGWGYKGATSPSRLGIFTDAAERLTVNANGCVGIGTTAPAEKLTVHGNISASGSLSAAATTYGFVSAGRDLGDILVRTKGDQTMSGIKTFSSPATFSMPTRGYVTTFDYLGSVSPAGQRAFITDAQGSLADYIGVNAGGGGSHFSPVYSDGSNWIQG